MEEYFKVFNYLKGNFFRVTGLIAIMALILIGVSQVNIITNLSNKIIIIVLLCLFWFFIWHLMKTHLPKTKNNKKGIYIAIKSEKNENDLSEQGKLKLRVKNDFIKELIELFNTNQLSDFVQIHFLKDHQIDYLYEKCEEFIAYKPNKEKKIKTKKEKKFENIAEKIGAIYIVWGDVKVRKNNELFYIVDLKSLIKSEEVKNREEFIKSIQSGFVSNFRLQDKFEIDEFNYLTKSNFVSATYIIGMAAYISKEYKIAYNLHVRAKDQIVNLIKRNPNLKRAKKTLQEIINYEAFHLANINIEKENYKKALDYNNVITNTTQQDLYCIFQRVNILYKSNDIDQALELNKEIRKYNELSFLYNKAFLLMMKGNYDKGLSIYWQLMYNTKDRTIAGECIEYMEKELIRKPDLPILHFILGYLYYEKKENLPQAHDHFEKFLEKAGSEFANKRIIEISNEKVIRIEKEMELNRPTPPVRHFC
ncbi:MAG: tetratricopeptide repeat protein [Bacillota bacterium]